MVSTAGKIKNIISCSCSRKCSHDSKGTCFMTYKLRLTEDEMNRPYSVWPVWPLFICIMLPLLHITGKFTPCMNKDTDSNTVSTTEKSTEVYCRFALYCIMSVTNYSILLKIVRPNHRLTTHWHMHSFSPC